VPRHFGRRPQYRPWSHENTRCGLPEPPPPPPHISATVKTIAVSSAGRIGRCIVVLTADSPKCTPRWNVAENLRLPTMLRMNRRSSYHRELVPGVELNHSTTRFSCCDEGIEESINQTTSPLSTPRPCSGRATGPLARCRFCDGAAIRRPPLAACDLSVDRQRGPMPCDYLSETTTANCAGIIHG